jgi:hypothetical protein
MCVPFGASAAKQVPGSLVARPVLPGFYVVTHGVSAVSRNINIGDVSQMAQGYHVELYRSTILYCPERKLGSLRLAANIKTHTDAIAWVSVCGPFALESCKAHPARAPTFAIFEQRLDHIGRHTASPVWPHLDTGPANLIDNGLNARRVFYSYDRRPITCYALVLALSAVNDKVLGELADALLR